MEASMLHLTLSIKGIPAANAKPNKVEKDVENVYVLNIGEEPSDGEQKPQRGRGGRIFRFKVRGMIEGFFGGFGFFFSWKILVFFWVA